MLQLRKKRVVWYCAIGRKHSSMARYSIDTLKKYGKFQGKIVVITDNREKFPDCQIFSPIEGSKIGFPSRRSKILGWKYLKDFDEGIFLDCDSEILSDINEVWNFDECAGMVQSPILKTFAFSSTRTAGNVLADIAECKKTIPPEQIHFNSGVICAKINEWLPIVDKWYKEWEKFQWTDEFPLLRAIQEKEIKTLEEKFNTLVPSPDSVIYHYYNNVTKKDWATRNY